MTSVQNHLRLLSGNKSIGLFIIVVLLLSSCKTKQVKYREGESNKPTPEVVVKPEVKDPVPEKPKDTTPKETTPEKPKSDRRSGPQNVANIAMLVPFNAKSYYPGGQKLSKESERFLNFYQGFLLGAEKMKSEGLMTYLDVYDTQKNVEIFNKKLDGIDPSKTNIVIGSYNTSNIRSLAEWSKENETLAVSPWKSSSSVATDNPYFLQVSPTLDMYLGTIVDQISMVHGNSDVIIVSRDIPKEKKIVDRIKNIKDDRPGVGGEYKSLIVPASVNSLTPELILPALNNRGTTVMIVPYYKSEDFVQAFLSRLAMAGVDRNIVVYGMPQWLDFNSISLGQLSNLNVRLPLHQYVDVSNAQIKSFNRTYFDRYGMIPTHNEAYKGYDLALFIGRSYRDFGTDFLLQKDGSMDKFSSIHMSIDRNVPASSTGSEDYSRINFFENKAIQMCEFTAYGIRRL